MRRLLLVVALVGCGHSKASGPAWPEPSKTADDGGESIAPQPSATYAAVVEKSADVEEAKPATTEAAKPVAATEDKPATTAPATTTPATDEVITTEEIIIEIDD
jgi:hypothetical protein